MDGTIQNILDGSAPAIGQDYFRSLVCHLTQSCDVDYALVARLDQHFEPPRLRTVAVARRGVLIDNLRYDVEGSPCQVVLREGFHWFPKGVQQEFPQHPLLRQLGADSHIGAALRAGDGEPLGIVALLNSRAIAEPQRTQAILRVVAARAGAELERERAQEALKASEIRYRTLVDHAADAIFLHDRGGRIVDVNQQACDSLQMTREELIGASPLLFDVDATEGQLLSIHDRLRGGETVSFDSRHRRGDGAVFPVEVRIRPFVANGFPQAISLVRDITQRKRTEELLRRTQERLSRILEGADVGTWDWNLSTDEVVFSREWKRQLGYEEDEIADHFDEWRRRVHPRDLPEALRRTTRAKQHRHEDYEAEFRMRHKDGSWRWILARGSVLRDVDGEPSRMLGIHLDITDRKRAEETLFRQKTVFERIATGGTALEVLDELVELVQAQLPGMICSILTLEDGHRLRVASARHLPADYNAAIDGVEIGPSVGSCGTAAHRGEPVCVGDIEHDPLWANFAALAIGHGLRSCWSVPIYRGQGERAADDPRVLGTFAIYGAQPGLPDAHALDVLTGAAHLAGIVIGRDEAERTIQESQRFIERIANATPHTMYVFDVRRQRVVYANRQVADDLGYSQEELVRHNGDLFLTLLHPEDQEQLSGLLSRWDHVPDDAVLETQYRLRDSAGDWHWFLGRDTVFTRDAEGRVERIIGTAQDITAWKQAEEELASRQAELLHASRLTSVGQMVAALSHEVAQPLNAIGNLVAVTAELLRRSPHPSDPLLTHSVAQIAEQNRRCAEILQRLRDYSRRSPSRRQTCSLNPLLNDSVALLSNELRGQGIRLAFDLEEGVPEVVVDRTQIQQVIVNLLSNARDAIAQLPIERRLITLRSRRLGAACMFEVEDRGPGLPEGSCEQVFEPFYTTKSAGMGIGLSICRRILRDHGGRIASRSMDHGGACFRVELPLAPGDAHE